LITKIYTSYPNPPSFRAGGAEGGGVVMGDSKLVASHISTDAGSVVDRNGIIELYPDIAAVES